MALFKRIKEKLGFGTGSDDADAGETTVTVEKDHAEAEPAVADDGTPSEPAGSDAGSVDDVPSEADATAETDDPSEADATAETDDPSEADATAETDDPSGEPDEGTTDPAPVDGDAVEEIKGIGPAYGERLAEIGIETVAALAAADPAEVAEGAKVSEKRASTWIDRAKEF